MLAVSVGRSSSKVEDVVPANGENERLRRAPVASWLLMDSQTANSHPAACRGCGR